MASTSGAAHPETEAEIEAQIRQTEQKLQELNRKLQAKILAKVEEGKRMFLEFMTISAAAPMVGQLLEEMDDLVGRAVTAKERCKLWIEARDALSFLMAKSSSELPFHRFTEKEISAFGEFKACMEADKKIMEALCDRTTTTICHRIREMERKTREH